MSEIIPRAINEELVDSYMLYSMSVIVGRAIPDVRDGLKPVQRRILYGMSQLSLRHNQPFKKCARIIGEVMGKYHPHGDMAIYDALVRMAQDFSMRYPLVDGQGNFGSIDRDPPAAYRYTEARMQTLAEELLTDLDKNTVEMTNNFDGTLKEPDVLPSKIPNLLMNGTSGIAVGMMTGIPPHNLNELVAALDMLIDNPEVSIDELLTVIKGPDFPTGAMVVGKENIKKIYTEGKGRLILRGEAEIVEGKSGNNIVITEIPYNVSKADLIEQIAKAANNIRDVQIRNIRDESDKKGMRVLIELKRGADPNVVLNLLYKHSQLQNTFSVSMLVIDEKKRPVYMNLKQILSSFLNHRVEIITRRTEYLLEQASKRAHIVEGLIKATRAIDTVVDIIKNSKDEKEASANLQEVLEISEEQSKAILDMRLKRLTSLEIMNLMNEHKELVEKISYYRELLANKNEIYDIIKEDLAEMKGKYGDKRRTRIVSESANDYDIMDFIKDEDIVILVTSKGYIKSTPVDTYKKQNRGGVGVKGVTTRDTDFVETILTTTRKNKTIVITSKGKLFFLNNHEIDFSNRTSKGKLISNYIRVDPDEYVRTVLPFSEEHMEKQYLVITTKLGKIKRTKLSLFANTRINGIKAINIGDDDSVIGAIISECKDEHIIISTANGMVIRFDLSSIRPIGRTAQGVKAMRLSKNDYIVSSNVIHEADERYLLTATENGSGKRTKLPEYRPQNRGGIGLKNLSNIKKTGKVVGTLIVDDDMEIIMATKKGMSIRIPVSDIRFTGRVTQGVKIVELKEDDELATIAIVTELVQL